MELENPVFEIETRRCYGCKHIEETKQEISESDSQGGRGAYVVLVPAKSHDVPGYEGRSQ